MSILPHTQKSVHSVRISLRSCLPWSKSTGSRQASKTKTQKTTTKIDMITCQVLTTIYKLSRCNRANTWAHSVSRCLPISSGCFDLPFVIRYICCCRMYMALSVCRCVLFFLLLCVCLLFNCDNSKNNNSRSSCGRCSSSSNGKTTEHIRKLHLCLMNACQDKAYLIFHFYYVTLAHTHLQTHSGRKRVSDGFYFRFYSI